MPSVPSQYASMVNSAAAQLGISPNIVAAQLELESSWNPNAVSPAGAEGIAQFLPSTFSQYGSGSPFNPSDAINAYVNYMGALLHQYNGNVANALAAYNAGSASSSAGQSYASQILSAAGQPMSTQAGTPGSSGATPVGFPNPFNIPSDIGKAVGQGLADALKAILMPFIEIAIWVTESVVGIGLMAAGAFIILQDSKEVRHAEADVVKVGAVAGGAPEAVPGIEAAEKESDRVIEGRKQRKAAIQQSRTKRNNAFKATGEPFVEDWGFGPGFTSEKNIPPRIKDRNPKRTKK